MNDVIVLGGNGGGKTGGERPKPSMTTPSGAAPSLGAVAPVASGPAPAPQQQQSDAVTAKAIVPDKKSKKKQAEAAAAPGFSFN